MAEWSELHRKRQGVLVEEQGGGNLARAEHKEGVEERRDQEEGAQHRRAGGRSRRVPSSPLVQSRVT